MDTNLRLEEMVALRKKGLTYKKIAEIYGISHQRVHQILGSDGIRLSFFRTTLKNPSWIDATRNLTNKEIMQLTGASSGYVSRFRSKIRHPNKNGMVSTEIAYKWEEWASKYLMDNGIDNQLMNFGTPGFDILALGDVKINVKASSPATTKTSPHIVSKQYRFRHSNINGADLLLCVTTDTEDIFIVPVEFALMRNDTFAFCYPTLRPTMNKFTQFHNRLSLIYEIHQKKCLTLD